MQNLDDICFRCVHFCNNNDDGLWQGCRAFPEGIPSDITEAGSHDIVRKGQTGEFTFTKLKI